LDKSRLLLVSSFSEDYFSSLNVDTFCPSKDLEMHSPELDILYVKRSVDPEVLELPISPSGDDSAIDILSNMGLYDNLTPSSLEDYVVWGRDILFTQHFLSQNRQEVPNLLFTGPSLTGEILSSFFKYSLAFSLTKDLGVYKVFFDDADLYYISRFLNQFDQESYSKISDRIQFKNTGYLAKCGGRVECLFKKEFGEQQLVEIDSEDLHVFPLREGEKATVLLKGGRCPEKEFEVEGGDLGFVVDTRSADFWHSDSSGILSKYKNWMGVLGHLGGAKS
jgi:hypothetical protein